MGRSIRPREPFPRHLRLASRSQDRLHQTAALRSDEHCCHYERGKSVLKQKQVTVTLPQGRCFQRRHATAELVVHPSCICLLLKSRPPTRDRNLLHDPRRAHLKSVGQSKHGGSRRRATSPSNRRESTCWWRISRAKCDCVSNRSGPGELRRPRRAAVAKPGLRAVHGDQGYLYLTAASAAEAISASHPSMDCFLPSSHHRPFVSPSRPCPPDGISQVFDGIPLSEPGVPRQHLAIFRRKPLVVQA